jgi:hypothetical protein
MLEGRVSDRSSTIIGCGRDHEHMMIQWNNLLPTKFSGNFIFSTTYISYLLQVNFHPKIKRVLEVISIFPANLQKYQIFTLPASFNLLLKSLINTPD